MKEFQTNLPEEFVLPPIIGPGNDYDFLKKKVGSVDVKLPISIVLPVYNRIEMLRRTMAMLTHQTYPLDLIEVIIADDGSNDNPEQLIDEFDEYFDVNYVRQKDEGYRLSHIRNLGVRSARNDNIIILDCDMAPVPNLVETYAKWLILNEKLILIGHRRYVDANHINPDEVLVSPACMLELPPVATKNAVMKKSPSKDWREPIYEETNLLRNSPHPFRTSSCGNVAFHRRIFDDAGTFDENFTAWGAEDNEFGYRAWNAGYYFIPLLDALGLHQEPPGGREFVDREAGKLITRPMLLDMVPIYRDYDPEIISSTPSISVILPIANENECSFQAIESVNNQIFKDYKFNICYYGIDNDFAVLLNERYGDNPRFFVSHKPDLSYASATNYCIERSKGMYILQLKQNDDLSPNALEDLFAKLEADPNVSCVFGNSRLQDRYTNEILNQTGSGFSRESLLQGGDLSTPRLFRKRDWSRAGGFSEYKQNTSDFDFYLKLSNIGLFSHVDSNLNTIQIGLYNENEDFSESEMRIRVEIIQNMIQNMGIRSWKVLDNKPTNLELPSISFVKDNPDEPQRDYEPFVSVVIITKNRENLLPDAIKSSLNQNYKNFEVVIIDDGSTDNTAMVVNQFNDDRIRYVYKESTGIPNSRNVGVKESRGEYIVIMDDDDLMLPNRIRDHVNALKPDSAGSHGGWIDQNSKLEHEYYPGAPHGYSQILFGGKVMLHPASMIKRDILLDYPYDENYSFGTDYVMNLEIARDGHRLEHSGSYVLLRRFHGGNVTLTNAGEQQSTAKVRVKEFLNELSEDDEQSMRQEWRETRYYTETPKPKLAELYSKFPWIKSISVMENNSVDKNNSKQVDNYFVNERWKQIGQTLHFDALTRDISFEMPFGWKIEHTHPDLFRIANFVLTSPWEKDILKGWIPSRNKGWRTSLSFSGGVDSTACMLILPKETILCYHERDGFKSQLNHANAHHFIEELEKDGRPVIIVKSNHEQIRLDRGKGAGFSTDLAAAVHIILLADYLELGAIALGMPLENAYLFHGHTGRDFTKSNFWKTHRDLLSKAGLDLVFPTAGVSEILNQKIVEHSKYEHFAESCLRSKKRGEVCGICWKCFRKNSMKGKDISIKGEVEKFLQKRPLKQAISTLYAMQRLPNDQFDEIKQSFPDLIELLNQDYSLIERYIPSAIEILPIDLQDYVKSNLDRYASPMTPGEFERLISIDLNT